MVPIRFTVEASRVRAADFVKLLQQHLGMRGLVVGPDFAMGHNREGTPEFLAALGQMSGFALKVAQLEESDGVPISSSLIRGALSRGDAGAASRLLGRNYAVSGKVVHGEGRGARELGFPTANIAVPSQKALPSDGIYAAMAFVEGKLVSGRRQHRSTPHVWGGQSYRGGVSARLQWRLVRKNRPPGVCAAPERRGLLLQHGGTAIANRKRRRAYQAGAR